MGKLSRDTLRALLLTAFLLAFAGRAEAYVGPGAGFVLAPLFIGLLVGFLAVVVVLALPFLVLFRLVFRKPPPRGRVKRVVVVGLDGLDPSLTRRYMKRGLLPNLKRLAEEGSFVPLAIPVPSISPSSWSCFLSGTDASYHCIYDFLTRDPCSYAPVLSSVKVEGPRRTFDVGPWRIPLGSPRVTLLRRSKPFFKVLSENRVDASILRVPVTFPPERFRGRMLSGMCVPDLRGTQGSFSFFTTKEAGVVGAPDMGYAGDTEGMIATLVRDGETWRGEILGPMNTLRKYGGVLSVAIAVRVDREAGRVRIQAGKERVEVAPRTWSRWVRLTFRPGLGMKVRGIVRFYVTSIEPELEIYVTPVHIDPEKPALKISHPPLYSSWLAGRQGPYATLGLAEDTWALNEGVIDEQAFLEQAWLYHEERERQLFAALETTRSGCVTVVFDASDRIQHMFFRTLDPDHPANEGRDPAEHKNVIQDLYMRMDDLVGRVRARLSPDDALVILSDHGFCSFKRGVNLNTWLHREGYLHLKEGVPEAGDWFEGVDWDRTRAFCLGLTGLFLNRKGREARGTVEEGEEADALRREIREKLKALVDPANGERAIREVYDAREVYEGPYRDEAPDLLIGYGRGYRNSWECARGRVGEEVFTDNKKPWSGDHCVDPRVVPGVLFTNFPLQTDRPAMPDIAPTLLDLLGVEPPGYMTGRSLLRREEER